ncbi:hypothetical protein JXE04_02030 [Patescibacteria group bacterium]|nr:hypothetical protein [Patescibacteria group bacterium]
MFDYLQQFNKLPKELREKVSSPAAMEVLSSLENKYKVNLAMLVMQVMVKQILMKDLTAHFIAEMSLSSEQAQALSQELQEKLFFSVATYLGLKMASPLSPEDKELAQLMKDNAIILPSSDLMNRCRQILLTYRKGIRTKIDTRAALQRNVNQGGLDLDSAAADRLLRALDLPLVPKQEEMIKPKASAELNNLINQQDGASYNLKSAIASGQIKTPESLVKKFKQNILDTEHELEAPADELEIEAPAKTLYLQEASNNTPDKTVFKQAEDVAKKEQTSVQVAPINSIMAVKMDNKALVSTEKDKLVKKNVQIKNNDNVNTSILNKQAVSVATQTPKTIEDKSKMAEVQMLKPKSAKSLSFKKSTSAPSNVWNKLFKKHITDHTKLNVKNNIAKAPVSSHHLEEAVKAAVKEASISARPSAGSDFKTKIEDVKLRPKVMGPLEELRYLDLVNFRRLGANPKEITNKITNKIHLLEKDGYDHMVEGVKAWRQSPVNRLYVRLVQEAIISDMTLREAIADKQSKSKDSLSIEEIEAIVSMNNKLMF